MSESVILFHRGGEDIDQIIRGFHEADITVLSVSDFEEGLNRIRTGVFGIAVVDVTMTDSDGLGLVRRIYESRGVNTVIVLTDGEFIDKVGTAAIRYLQKPVDVRELTAIVDSLHEIADLRQRVSDTTLKVSHLEVVNEIARETLLSHGEESLLWNIANLIHEKLHYFNVNIFLADHEETRMVLEAFAGGFGEDLVSGYSLPFGEGIVGWVAKHRVPILTGNASSEPRRILGFSFEEHVQSELAVPVIFSDRVIGVVHIESEERDAFRSDDVLVLETIADQLSLALENRRLSRELRDSYELSAAINDSVPVSIILVDRSHLTTYVNRTFLQSTGVTREQVMYRPIHEFLSPELVEKLDFDRQLGQVFERGVPLVLPNIYHSSPNHPDKVLTITFVRVQAGQNPLVMLLLQDVTEFSEKTQQLLMLREISIAMQGVFDRDKLLHMILTNVTAGFAIGFNRAFLFLVNRKTNTLIGTMAAGPTNRSEAYRIWDELSRQSFTFKDYLDHINQGRITLSGLQELVEGMSFDLAATTNILTETVHTGSHIHITDAWNNPGIDEPMKVLLAASEFVTIPLIAKNEVIGVLFADNAYSGKPITDESIEKLTMFSMTAAIAIENSEMLSMLEEKVQELEEAYSKLEKTHAQLIRHEKLAAIGEVSARLAHEIRNPLSTIGGFAKSIPGHYENRDRTIRNARIILEEVQRLENILTNVLDFTKSSAPHRSRIDINELVREILPMMEETARRNTIITVLSLDDDEIFANIDPSQIKQVLINLIQNAFNAMPQGGSVEISTKRLDDNEVRIRVIDTGTGIPKEYMETIFDPFFTTRGDGTGLGLPIAQQIVQNHGGTLELESQVGEGTTVTVFLPLGT